MNPNNAIHSIIAFRDFIGIFFSFGDFWPKECNSIGNRLEIYNNYEIRISGFLTFLPGGEKKTNSSRRKRLRRSQSE